MTQKKAPIFLLTTKMAKMVQTPKVTKVQLSRARSTEQQATLVLLIGGTPFWSGVMENHDFSGPYFAATLRFLA